LKKEQALGRLYHWDSLSGAFVLDGLSRFRVQNDGISC